MCRIKNGLNGLNLNMVGFRSKWVRIYRNDFFIDIFRKKIKYETVLTGSCFTSKPANHQQRTRGEKK